MCGEREGNIMTNNDADVATAAAVDDDHVVLLKWKTFQSEQKETVNECENLVEFDLTKDDNRITTKVHLKEGGKHTHKFSY